MDEPGSAAPNAIARSVYRDRREVGLLERWGGRAHAVLPYTELASGAAAGGRVPLVPHREERLAATPVSLRWNLGVPRSYRLCRKSVTVTMDDPPFTILSSIDVCDAKDVVGSGASVARHCRALVADCVGEITADTRSKKFEVVGSAVREPGGDPTEGLSDIPPPTTRDPKRTQQRDRIFLRPHRDPWIHITVVNRCLGIDLTRQNIIEKHLKFAHVQFLRSDELTYSIDRASGGKNGRKYRGRRA